MLTVAKRCRECNTSIAKVNKAVFSIVSEYYTVNGPTVTNGLLFLLEMCSEEDPEKNAVFVFPIASIHSLEKGLLSTRLLSINAHRCSSTIFAQDVSFPFQPYHMIMRHMCHSLDRKPPSSK